MMNSMYKNFRELFKKVPIGYIILDYDLNIKGFNKAFIKALEERRRDILDTSFKRYISRESLYDLLEKIDDLKREKTFTSVSIYMENEDRKFYANLSMDIIVLDEKGYITCVIVDISKEQRITNELEYLSLHDELTGLYNRRFFEEELERLDVKRNLPLTLVMADVNGLKLANDSFGHEVGDELLIRVSKALKRACREDDIIARIGGDEFVLILPNTDEEKGNLVIDRIKDELRQERVFNFEVSVSFGSSTKYRVGEDIADIFKRAEDDMYRNKLIEGQEMRIRTVDKALLSLYLISPYEAAHSRRVSELARRLAKKMNFSDLSLREIERIGLVHDIGKIAIDRSILLKNTPLTKDEEVILKKHPEVGYRMLDSVHEMRDMAKIVLHHHERWDGKGYPKGLSGRKIPLGSRIISVCGAYDYMTGDTHYRKALDKAQAIEEMRKNRGIQFDPEIVDVFLRRVIS